MSSRVSDEQVKQAVEEHGDKGVVAIAKLLGIDRTTARVRIRSLGLAVGRPRADRTLPPKCHPERPHYARWMCRDCYDEAIYVSRFGGKGAANHKYLLKSRYGITPDEYLDLFQSQDGRCGICRKRPRSKRLAVDHDHEIEKELGVVAIRGLLCGACNRAIGKFEWDAEVINRAITYLEQILVLRNQYLSGKGTH